MPRKKPRKQELAAINGTANARRRREKGAPIPEQRKGDAIRAEKQDTADSHTCTEGKADRLLDNPPDIPILSADVFLRGKVGNGCGEAGGGDAPCKHIQRQNQLIQTHALCADGV